MAKEQNLDDVAACIYQRWGATARPQLDKEQTGQLLAISIGLGALFNESIDAERKWMNTPNKELRGTPYRAVLQGRISEVLAAVESERNLR